MSVIPQVPSVSVVIPIHNNREHILRVLEPLMEGMLAGDELLVVDDRSTDGSAEKAAMLGVRVIPNAGKPGAAGARNTGAALTSNDWILFVDSDAVTPADWRGLLNSRITHGADAVQAVYSSEAVGKNIATFYKNFYYHYTFTRRIRSGRVRGCGTFFFAVHRDRFLALGGFDENLRGASIEDADFAERLCAAGGTVLLAPEIEVLHLREYCFVELLRYDWRMMKAKALYILRRNQALGSPSISMASSVEMLPIIVGAAAVWCIPTGLALLIVGNPAGIWIAVGGFAVVAAGQVSFWVASIRSGGLRGLLACLITIPDLLLIVPAVIMAVIGRLAGRKY